MVHRMGARALRHTRPGERRFKRRFKFPQVFDAGSVGFPQFISFTGYTHEGTGGLFARHNLGRVLQRECCFDPVTSADTLVWEERDSLRSAFSRCAHTYLSGGMITPREIRHEI